MFINKYRVAGVLGGMGPDATVDFFRNVINNTTASCDQDHIPLLIFNNPKVPDRTEAVKTGKTEKIIQYLTESAITLEKGGADFIVIPCNTAHTFINEIRQSVKINVFSMIDETVKHVMAKYPGIDEICIMGTSGTMKSRLYQDAFEEKNIKYYIPEEDIQEKYVMGGIYSIKAGKDLSHAESLLIKALDHLKKTGCSRVVLGCTEIPIVLNRPSINGFDVINPTNILARITINESHIKQD
ncbi:MAG: aspartate/glutamate racemase family protein [bacterium]|nr:aspartate/glutamate racemase family protein [bacterium]